MIVNRPDWCISRQRNWGVPIPLFVHQQTGALHPQTKELIEQVAQRIEKVGIDAWFDLDPAELLGDAAADYEKSTDTLDVWFDSGVTHASVLETREGLNIPAQLYLEGSDQHRGWFQSSLLTAIAMRGVPPYDTVLTHGFTVDAQGMKMSKSKGNVLEPQKVIKNLGADVLRLWVAATDYRNEMNVSDEILKRVADSYRRLRNTARFLLANLHDFDPTIDCVDAKDMLPLDRWAVSRAHDLQAEVIEAYDQYTFLNIYQKVHHFCSVDLGAFYLDIIKDRQYTVKSDVLARRSAQTAMYHIIEALSRWLAPILSFTADELWEHIPGERPHDNIFLCTWYDGLFVLDSNEAMNDAFWTDIMRLRETSSKALETLRKDNTIGSSLAAEVDVYCDGDLYDNLQKLDDELRFVLITSYARLHPADQRPDDAIEGEGFWLSVKATEHEKCVRCWHHREEVGQNTEHPELCGRCVVNLGEGETRQFA
jgi:isoleucyl-tRNA synthetase